MLTIEENRIFTSTTSKLVKNSMSNVITNGTGTAAKVDGIIQGGKTGTATGEGGATTHGWFAGYFELDNKLYTLVILGFIFSNSIPILFVAFKRVLLTVSINVLLIFS